MLALFFPCLFDTARCVTVCVTICFLAHLHNCNLVYVNKRVANARYKPSGRKAERRRETDSELNDRKNEAIAGLARARAGSDAFSEVVEEVNRSWCWNVL